MKGGKRTSRESLEAIIAKKMRELRQKTGLGVSAFAQSIGWNSGHCCAVENRKIHSKGRGRRYQARPSFAMFVDYCEAAGRNPGRVLSEVLKELRGEERG